mmetsp:Transcript_15252/g.59645  ORF Transcript_15252/g.59645 Transcript_15252/m.59645 type:complete len:481 (+) Transcript_15252:139-1581(+)
MDNDDYVEDSWTIDSWRKFPIKQQPPYPEEAQPVLKEVLDNIRQLPPLVGAGEVERLKRGLALAGEGKSFVLQGGDCAERFVDCQKELIENKIRIILQMSLVFIWRTHVPVVRIVRGAGQFAKPRSSSWETVKIKEKQVVDGAEKEVVVEKKIASFRGDNVNGYSIDERTPDPNRLLKAYFHSAATINYIRALVSGGFASLRYPHKWDLDSVKNTHTRDAYRDILKELGHGIQFLMAVGQVSTGNAGINQVDIFTSHEGLVLEYEAANTFTYASGNSYNLGAHFLWIGDRTRALDGAHVEYFRGIKNPVGVKCGPTMQPEELGRILPILNPDREAGKLVLITRFGKDKVAAMLPPLIDAARATGVPVTWICDPMHGNTTVTESGLKTRKFDSILAEIEATFQVHDQCGTILGGIHLEMTGENVTECTGGAQELDSSELSTAYETYCDPRLNYTQSLDIAFRLSELVNQAGIAGRSDSPIL